MEYRSKSPTTPQPDDCKPLHLLLGNKSFRWKTVIGLLLWRASERPVMSWNTYRRAPRRRNPTTVTPCLSNLLITNKTESPPTELSRGIQEALDERLDELRNPAPARIPLAASAAVPATANKKPRLDARTHNLLSTLTGKS